MARKPFVVLDAEILSSSVWSETAPVRLVWITLLILCDTEGYVGASVPGIASAAGVTLQEADDAVRRLQEPDAYSRTKKDDGRRLEVSERGFRILNFQDHLDRLSAERTKARERVRKFRERKRQKADGNVTVRSGNRDQGPENREQVRTSVPESSLVVGREVVAPSRTNAPTRLPASPFPEQRANDATTSEIQRLQGELGKRLAQLSEHPNSREMVTEWCRKVTAYTSSKGEKVRGAADYRTIQSVDRLERSISDADWHLGKLDAMKPGEVKL